MALNFVSNPYSYYNNRNKTGPLWNGFIYVGIPDLDPTIAANQLTVTAKQEDGSQVSIEQPIRTNSGGYAVDVSGNPVVLLVDGNYAIRVNNHLGNLALEQASVLESLPVTISDQPVLSVDTVADLRLFEPEFDGQIIELLGHTDAGLGDGEFWYDQTDVSSLDDDGRIIVTTGGARWERRVYEFVTPEMYGVTPTSPSIPQATLDTGLNLEIGIGSYTMLDLRFAADGQKITGASKDETVVYVGAGVGLRNYAGADTGTSRFNGTSVTDIMFTGDYVPTDTDDWALASGTTKTLLETNVGILYRITNNSTISDCRFINVHDGIQFHAGVSSFVERNQFDLVQRGIAYNNGTFFGDVDFKCTSQKARDNYFKDSWFGIWATDLVDNSSTENNVTEFINTGEFYFNCSGVDSKNYHESLYEGVRVDGGFAGELFVADNSFFGGTPGNFWGDGDVIHIASGTGSGARVQVGKLTGSDDKPWIGYGATAEFRGKRLLYNGFNEQQPGIQFIPEQDASTGQGAVIKTIYFTEADQFELFGYITEVNGVATASGGYFKIAVNSDATQITEIENTDANGTVNQNVEIFVGASFFQLINNADSPQNQKVELRINRTLIGAKF